MTDELVVVKVGGSLFDLPDLAPRLRAWLDGLGAARVLLVAGGGRAADVVRTLDQRHGLGEEAAHWLALRALSLTAHFLHELLPGTQILDGPTGRLGSDPGWTRAVLEPFAFLRAIEGLPGSLPHSWDVTSDAIGAEAAVRFGAGRLLLLKSAALPTGSDWHQASRAGLVDKILPEVLARAGALQAAVIDFRAWRPGHVTRAAHATGGPAAR